MSSTTTTVAERHTGFDLWAYIQIARVDHWFKNVFMLLGVILAVFYEPKVVAWSKLVPLVVAVLATCLVASSNYVLNELLDGPHDLLHPKNRFRPVPSGRVRPAIVKTVATTGDGVRELVQAIEQFRAHSASATATRRRERSQNRLRDIVSARLLSKIDERLLTAMADRVAAGEIDPYSAADDLLAKRTV